MNPTDRTPASVWRELQRGNARFIDGNAQHPRQDVDRRNDLAGRQQPLAALFGCSDSRLAAEIIFDLGLGDLFVVRNAGQVISSSVLGSLEYAVDVLEVPLILVLGHDECGAVRAAIDTQVDDPIALPPHIAAIVDKIVPAVKKVSRARPSGPVDSGLVAREHLRDTVAELLDESELISHAIATNKVALVGANYRLSEGLIVPDVLLGNVTEGPQAHDDEEFQFSAK